MWSITRTPMQQARIRSTPAACCRPTVLFPRVRASGKAPQPLACAPTRTSTTHKLRGLSTITAATQAIFSPAALACVQAARGRAREEQQVPQQSDPRSTDVVAAHHLLLGVLSAPCCMDILAQHSITLAQVRISILNEYVGWGRSVYVGRHLG